ncbi:hypothetical protein D3C86_1138230 [compost metagenome]
MAVDAVEVGKALQRRLQRRGVVVACAAGARHAPQARREEAALALDQCARGLDAIEPDPQRVWPVLGAVGYGLVRDQAGQPGLAADMGPEITQPRHAVLGRVAGDDGGVQRADGDARYPVRLDPGLGQPLIDARLIGAQRAAALQHQRPHGIAAIYFDACPRAAGAALQVLLVEKHVFSSLRLAWGAPARGAPVALTACTSRG